MYKDGDQDGDDNRDGEDDQTSACHPKCNSFIKCICTRRGAGRYNAMPACRNSTDPVPFALALCGPSRQQGAEMPPRKMNIFESQGIQGTALPLPLNFS